MMLLLSIKKPQICKLYLSYELVMLVCTEFLVRESDASSQNLVTILLTVVYFTVFYYDLWVGVIGVLLC